jgi:hypothetical protein
MLFLDGLEADIYNYSYEQDRNLVQQPLVGQIDSLPLEAPDDGSSSPYGLPRVEIPPCDAVLAGNIDFMDFSGDIPGPERRFLLHSDFTRCGTRNLP